VSGPRVLMVIQRFRPIFTGHGLQIENLGRELVARGAQVEIVTHRVPGAPEFEAGTVPVRRFPMVPTNNPARLWWGHRGVLRYIAEGRDRFDVLHVHGFPPALALLLRAGRRAGMRTVVTSTLLGSDDPLTIQQKGRLAGWRYRTYARADRFIAICPALADLYPEAGLPGNKVAEIPVGVAVERFHPPADREAAAEAAGWPRDVPRALFVGGILRRKGVDVLLDAWLEVLRALPEARLYLAGPTEFGPTPVPGAPEFAARCQERARRPPLAGRVHFLGTVEDTSALYRAAHIFVFASRVEGFPNVLLEALASGTPCVAARIPGSTDVSVTDGETGYVVPQEDPRAMADRVVALLDDEETRRRMGAAARADAEARFALARVAEAHLNLYREILNAPAGAGESADVPG
jgi:glycosyltransferase involved in cell wall biosynthesis